MVLNFDCVDLFVVGKGWRGRSWKDGGDLCGVVRGSGRGGGKGKDRHSYGGSTATGFTWCSAFRGKAGFLGVCTGGGDELRSMSSLLFTVKGHVSKTSCVRFSTGGEGMLSSILFLSVGIHRHRGRA